MLVGFGPLPPLVMNSIVDSPFFVFIVFLTAQWLAAYVGDFLRRRRRAVRKGEWEDINTVETAVLTLLAIIIGFSFSMAVTRYDQRIKYEEAEANAIGTEYVRANLLPAESAAFVRELTEDLSGSAHLLLSKPQSGRGRRRRHSQTAG